MRRGITLFETIIVGAIIAIIGVVGLLNLIGRRSTTEFENATRQIVALLREAQSRSMSQASGTSWGVHFENIAGRSPLYALFATSYSSATQAGSYRLPASIAFATATVPEGTGKDILFSQITGVPIVATTVGIRIIVSPNVSATISVASSGAILY